MPFSAVNVCKYAVKYHAFYIIHDLCLCVLLCNLCACEFWQYFVTGFNSVIW